MEYKLGDGKSKYPWEKLVNPGDFFDVHPVYAGIKETSLRKLAMKKAHQYGGLLKVQKQWDGVLRVIKMH